VILSKLEWQVRDAVGVAVVQLPRLDREYLRRWASELGVAEKLEAVLEEAGKLQPGGS
jgi:hypothetical protein